MTLPTSPSRRSARHHGSPQSADLPAPLNSSPLVPGLPSPGWTSPHASSLRNKSRYGNMNPFPIGYASRPHLRSRLTLGGRAFPRKPWTSGGGDSHSSFATHADILTRVASTAGFRRRFIGHTTLPYPSTRLDLKEAEPCVNVTTSVVCLSPVTLSARDHSTSELLRTL